MKLLLDENFPEGYKKILSSMGHDVKHINHIKKGMTDKEVFDYAVQNQRIIISNDLDFNDFKAKKHFGIIKFNPSQYDESILLKVLSELGLEKITNSYIDFSKKGIFYYKKIYTKKNKFKQWHKQPLYVI